MYDVLRAFPTVAPMAWAVACFACTAPGDALAQRGAVVDPVDESLSRKGSTVKRWIKRPTADAEDVKLFDDYFDRYYFPSMTQTAPESLGRLGKRRYDLFRQFIDSATPENRKKITAKAYRFANRVIRGNYAREVKANAVLILGRLTLDGERPLPAANRFLCQVSELATRKRLPAYMQAAALTALTSHAERLAGLPEERRVATLRALTLATGVDAANNDADAAAKDWLRRRAAMLLATAAKNADMPQAAPLLVKLVADDSLSLDTRSAIAASLAGIPLPADGAAASAVLNLAKAVAKEEADAAGEFDDLQIAGGGVGRGRLSTRDPALAQSKRYRVDPQQSRVVYLRRGLAARLADLSRGLEAAETAAGPLAGDISTARQAIDAVRRLATDDGQIDLDVTAEVKAMASVVAGLSADAEPAATGPGPAAVEAAAGDNLF